VIAVRCEMEKIDFILVVFIIREAFVNLGL